MKAHLLASQLRAVADRLDRDGPTVDANAADVAASVGWPTSTLGSGTRSSDVARPTEAAALAAHPSEKGRPARGELADLARWETAKTDAGRAVSDLLRAMAPLLPTTVRDHHPAGVGNCLACNRPCVGSSDTDRLRSGLCHACYAAWRRHQGEGGTDRQVWLRARKETHWDDSHIEATAARHRRDPVPVSQAIGTMADIHERLGESR